MIWTVDILRITMMTMVFTAQIKVQIVGAHCSRTVVCGCFHGLDLSHVTFGNDRPNHIHDLVQIWSLYTVSFSHFLNMFMLYISCSMLSPLWLPCSLWLNATCPLTVRICTLSHSKLVQSASISLSLSLYLRLWGQITRLNCSYALFMSRMERWWVFQSRAVQCRRWNGSTSRGTRSFPIPFR